MSEGSSNSPVARDLVARVLDLQAIRAQAGEDVAQRIESEGRLRQEDLELLGGWENLKSLLNLEELVNLHREGLLLGSEGEDVAARWDWHDWTPVVIAKNWVVVNFL